MVVEIRNTDKTLIQVEFKPWLVQSNPTASDRDTVKSESGYDNVVLVRQISEDDRENFVNFIRVKNPSNGYFWEEQECSVFVKEMPYDDTTLAQTDGSGSGWSTYSSGKPDTESMYAEPIYNNSNGSGSGSGGSIYGTKSSIHSPSGHQKPWSPGSSSSTSFNDESHYNDSIWSFDQSSSAYSSYGPSSGNFRDVVTKPGSARSVNGVSFNSSPFNGDKTLPPLPPGQSPFAGIRNVEMQTKFSSIAKTAGRKLAKKLFSMRRTSRSGGSDSPVERRVSSPEMTPCPQTKLKSYRGSLGDLSQPNGHLTPAKRSISRPNIPPPEPPSPPVVTLPPNGPPKVPLPPLPTQTVSINNVRSTSGVPFGNNQKATVAQEEQTNNHKNVYSNSNYYSPQSRRDSQSLSNPSENGPAQKSQEIHRSLSMPENGGDDFDDDYDDSDFYDSDSELIRNFVSAVQPIYSMEEEPLYQYYTYGISLKPEDDYQPVIPKNLGLTLDMLVPRVGQRTLWCELPEVMNSGILAILSDKQKQLQEAIFEILTSEVSYLKSLDVLISLFYESPELNAVLNQEEVKFIYGNITEVKECCQSFLSVLLKKWEESWYIQEIGEVINEYTMTKFLVYKEYCRNKPYQDRTLQRLRITNEDFVSIVKRIEENPKCQMLRVDSFLMLPMQRITRLPLLVNAVIQRTTSLKEKAICEEALKNLTNLVIDCNEAARESQDAEETATIMDKLEFPRGARPPVLGQLLLKGDFIKNPFDSNGKTGNNGQLNWTFRKSKRTVYTLILFSNYLLVAKKKSSGKYEVIDMVPSKDSAIKPLPNIEGGCKDFQHFFMLHFALKDTVYFLGARAQSEIEKWKKKFESLRPATKSPQSFEVLAIFPYQAQLEDELSFQPGDRILVTQTQPDGWYYGEKLTIYDTKETKSGWFPGNYCES